MVEMAAAIAILLISTAVLLTLLLGMPGWVQAVGALMAIAGFIAVSRWLVKETLRPASPSPSTLQKPVIEFDYVDAEDQAGRYAVEVRRVRDDYFEGVTLHDGMHHVFFLTRVKGGIVDSRSGNVLQPKIWAAAHRFDASPKPTIEA